MLVSNPTERKWFRDRVEKADDFKFTQNGKKAILNKLIQAEGLDGTLGNSIIEVWGNEDAPGVKC